LTLSTSRTALEELPNRLVRGVERRARGRRLPVSPDPEREQHELLGETWPCAERDEFDELWWEIVSSLRDLGLELGRGCYGGWDDADPALARSVWCLTRHLRPGLVVETGVARGLTTRLALEAIARNGAGRMWSVDLPPKAPGLANQTAIAVPPGLRNPWRLLRGTSRNRLPILGQELADQNLTVDLFVHDSLHTGRNVRFELEWAWARLSATGVAIVDDIEQNAAFTAFACAHPDARALVCDAADGRSQFGCLFRRAVVQ
jgi:predicted O-methyltransferase YrrM